MSEFQSSVQRVKVKCTDNNNEVQAEIWSYKPKEYMTVVMANQKINMKYNEGYGRCYVGNAYGLEFTAYDKDVTSE
jgi:hypothetical protein